MPRPDLTPNARSLAMRRFWRIFRLLVLLSIVVAAIGVILVARGDPEMHIHMLIATALGVGFTVLLGTSLMTLLFVSAESGHDEAATPHIHQESDEE